MFSSRFLKERSQDIGPKSLRLQMASLKSLYKFGVELDYFSPMRTYNAYYDTFAKRLWKFIMDDINAIHYLHALLYRHLNET